VNGINGSTLQGLEEFTSGDNLVSIVQFDFHLTLGSGVDVINNGLGYMLTKGSTGVSLEAPFDRGLCCDNSWCSSYSCAYLMQLCEGTNVSNS
jgi:hypothetical protein